MAFTHDSKSDPLKAEFDSDELLDRIEGDRALFMDIVKIFLEDTPGLIAALEAGVQSGNAEVVEKTAHAIKGSCAMISAKRLETLTHKLESMGRKGDLIGSYDLYQEVIDCFDGLKQIMASFLINNGPGDKLNPGV
jgi:HPt (histidine-containing phosphotransfer) domain-containing protein